MSEWVALGPRRTSRTSPSSCLYSQFFSTFFKMAIFLVSVKLQRPCTGFTARETGTTSCPTFGGDDLVPLVAVSTVMGTSAAHLGQTFFLHLSLKWRQTSRKLFFSLVCSMYGVCSINLDAIRASGCLGGSRTRKEGLHELRARRSNFASKMSFFAACRPPMLCVAPSGSERSRAVRWSPGAERRAC